MVKTQPRIARASEIPEQGWTEQLPDALQLQPQDPDGAMRQGSLKGLSAQQKASLSFPVQALGLGRLGRERASEGGNGFPPVGRPERPSHAQRPVRFAWRRRASGQASVTSAAGATPAGSGLSGTPPALSRLRG